MKNPIGSVPDGPLRYYAIFYSGFVPTGMGFMGRGGPAFRHIDFYQLRWD
jgi:hypothetical protein